MRNYWSKTLILLVIFNILLTPAFALASEETSFFASIGSLLRGGFIINNLFKFSEESSNIPTVQFNALVAQNKPGLAYTPLSDNYDVFTVTITAYSSSVDETDDTPFITASGSRTRDGVVAANFLPFGTRVKIPELFGDKTFIVEDRMHRRFSDRMDIWFPSKWEAKQFGRQTAQIIVFNEG